MVEPDFRLLRDRINVVSAAEVPRVLAAHPGLILGPGAVFGPQVLRDLGKDLGDALEMPLEERFQVVADSAVNAGRSIDEVRDAIIRFFGRTPVTGPLVSLVSIRWACVLSACMDLVFDEQFRAASQRRLLAQPVTVVSDFSRSVPPRSAPVFKLLGSLVRGDFVKTSVDYNIRRGTWSIATKTFVDKVRFDPTLCLGMSACPWVLWDLLGQMVSTPGSTPTSLLFLSEDPLLSDRSLQSYLLGRSILVSVDVDLPVLLGLTAEREDSVEQRSLPFPHAASTPLTHALRHFRELALLVNDHLHTPVAATETNQLNELLFSPSQPRWDPFVHDRDLPRTQSKELLDELELLTASTTYGSIAAVVVGAAATGKTTVLKRAAFDLAKRQRVVLWLLPSFYQDTQNVLLDLFRRVVEALEKRTRVVVFMDDPLAYGTLSAGDVVSAADSAGLEIVLVVGARTSEWKTRDNRQFVGSLSVLTELELADQLDDSEWARLPGYLLRLGVVSDSTEGDRLVKDALSRSARDVLSMLYWLVPETRRAIAHSIRDEYFRLGDASGLTRVLIGDLEKTSGILQQAYRLVAVAEHYRTPVPVEVLVSALAVPYSAWLDATATEGAAWGLFYADALQEHETFCYRTRNSVVAETIIRTINGGELSKSGEVAALETLLAACTGSQPAYREFCIRVLVPYTKLQQLDYREGMQLYDTATKALPYPDKTLVHHKGLWTKNKGADPIAARAILEQALETPVFPYASHGEANEHVHTSLAATELDAINQGKISFDEGKRGVLQHLQRARSARFFNSNAAHVEGRLMLELIKKSGDSWADRAALTVQTLTSVDRTLSMVRSRSGGAITSLAASDDIDMLEQLKADVLKQVGDIETLKAEANRRWEDSRNQDLFVIAARSLYADACGTERGTDFHAAYQYCLDSIAVVQRAGAVPRQPLYEVAVDIFYHWRLVRRVVRSAVFAVDWGQVKSFCDVILRGSPRPDPFHQYVYAVVLAHLGDWTQANALFSSLRRSELPRAALWTPRDYLLSDDGTPRQIQGPVRTLGDRSFVFSEDLQVDFFLSRGEAWPSDGETAHCYVRFSFGGPTATRLADGRVRA